MNWVELVVMILGAIGGTTGIISIYHAKSKKDTIDISNFHSLIEEERAERKNLLQEYHAYKNEVNDKVLSVKNDFEEMKQENQKMLKSIYQAYRCTLPEKMSECPVIQMFQDNCACAECLKKE